MYSSVEDELEEGRLEEEKSVETNCYSSVRAEGNINLDITRRLSMSEC